MEEFQIHFSEEQWDDLRHRLDGARLPKIWEGAGWSFGTERDSLTTLLDYWKSDYDWYAKERELNQYPQFTCEIGGVTVHFFYIRTSKKGTLPLILTHGWPDSFLRYAKLFPILNDYDLIVPSLPGFAFSTLPQKGFMNNAETAELWHKLMTDVLGYQEYAAAGGDMGRGVTCYLATRHPDVVRGIHLTDVGLVRELIHASDEELSHEELDYKHRASEWLKQEAAYMNIHSTKPETLAYALGDSPVGMASWLLEKYHAWSDPGLLTMDDLCDSLTLYWMTNTACTSIRAYYGNTFTLPEMGRVNVPTAIAAFPRDVLPAPREWTEKNYSVIRYTEMLRGGHFTALEQPEAFAEDISEFMEALK